MPQYVLLALRREAPSYCMAQRDLLEAVPQLEAGVKPPPFAAAAERLHQRNTWLGPAGTITPLHRDPYLNLLCQVSGSAILQQDRKPVGGVGRGGGEGGKIGRRSGELGAVLDGLSGTHLPVMSLASNRYGLNLIHWFCHYPHTVLVRCRNVAYVCVAGMGHKEDPVVQSEHGSISVPV